MSETPTQAEEMLGIHVDMSAQFFRVPDKKWNKLAKQVELFRDGPTPVRDVLRFVGQVLAARVALIYASGLAWAFYPHLLPFILRGAWDSVISLPDSVVSTAQFFLTNPFVRQSSFFPHINCWIASDSSEQAWGGYITFASGETTHCGGPWGNTWLGQHINVLELEAACRIVRLACQLSPDPLVICMDVDNTTALSYLRRGGGSIGILHQLAQQVLRFCITHRCILFRLNYIASKDNVVPDEISRSAVLIRPRLTVTVFAQFVRWVSLRHPDFVPLVEAFGSPEDRRLKRFCSPFLEEGSEGNFFHARGRDVFFVDPPASLVSSCLDHIVGAQLSAWVVTPRHRGAPWFTFLKASAMTKYFFGGPGCFYPEAQSGHDAWLITPNPSP
jgi:hypothetical protein